MKQYTVNGMSCAACSQRVEKAINSLEEVTMCSVSLLTNSMSVEGDIAPEKVVEAVRKAGYDASIKGKGNNTVKNDSKDMEESLEDKETPILKRRLVWSLGFLLVLMYLSMGHMMLDLPVPYVLEQNCVAQGILQMLLAGIVMVINQKFFVNGFKSLWHLAPNMDTLVALGSAASYIYSVAALILMSDEAVRGSMAKAMDYMNEFYFESAAMILVLITVGKMLESRSKGKTTNAIKALMRLAPKTALVERDGKELEILAQEVRVGDIFILKAGDSVSVDGVVIEGESAIDESALTGESIPIDKKTGDKVSCGTINMSGYLKCRATGVGSDTTISKIVEMVSDAAATKAPIAKIADKVSGIFVPAVMAISLITLLIWLLLGKEFGFALARAISVLVISCPCALGLATPVAIMVGNGVGARNGILFKNAQSLEQTGKTEIVALDKTGTITRGEPHVTDILLMKESVTQDEFLTYAYAVECRSEHPLAKAIVNFVDEKKEYLKENVPDITEYKVYSGNGVGAFVSTENGKKELAGGSYSFIKSKIRLEASIEKQYGELAEQGKTPLLFALGDELIGIIAVADVIKEESYQAIERLKSMGLTVVMLTGDNEKTARAIANQAGVDSVISGVLPQGKESVIRKLKEYGKVLMVGDGINDAPALTRADVGMAIGAGTDIAMEAAQVVLVKSKLSDVPAAIALSRVTLRNIHQNLFWAFFYNVIGIPLAAGALIALLGWELNPMFGAAAMSLSSFCVVSNALRINFARIHDRKKDITTKNKIDITSIVEDIKKEEEKAMEKTMKIEGMMCGHCEASVKKALEALEQVSQAEVSHKEGIAVVKLVSQVDNEVLKKVVEDKDYTVISVE